MINFDPTDVLPLASAISEGDVSSARNLAVRIVAQELPENVADCGDDCYNDPVVLESLILEAGTKLKYATVRESYEELIPAIIGYAACYLKKTEPTDGNSESSSESLEEGSEEDSRG